MKILARSLDVTGSSRDPPKLMAYAIWWDGITEVAIILGLNAVVIMQVFLIIIYDWIIVKKVLGS